MTHFNFLPSVDTSCGRISWSVSYAPKLEDVSSESSMPISVEFIPDYVGSPTTEKHRRLHCLPSGRSLPTYVSSNIRHSWSNDHGITPCVSPSPSPTYSDSQCSRNIGLAPHSHLPDCLPSTCLVPHIISPLAQKNTNLDEYWPLPSFALSSSSSPPTHFPGNRLQNVLLRSENAPLSVLLPRGLVNQALSSYPSRKSGKVECSSQEDIFRAKLTTASPYHISYPESKLQLRKSPGEIYIGTDLQKILYSGKSEVGSLSEWNISSCTSPWIPSRSSSRFSLLDEFDCPFAEDNEDLRGPCRVAIFDADSHSGDSASGELIPFRRSSEAAVGALVQMFKTAAPLRQDYTSSAISSQAIKEEAWTMKQMQHGKNKEDIVKTARGTASGPFISRTTADALEELRCYREVKKLILRRHVSQQLDMGPARNPVSEVSEGGLPSLDIGKTQISEGIEGGLRSLGIGQDKKLSSEGSSES
ncbi:autophagy-related protein 13b-like isoform X2 [Iris pallida]|uniref:Autophagy-related protein 13b-like isoform X2 n=1 Tax=Iris pallida TaxID=29817 RepID=A0AAX6E285_IRIPA|nr:autophagy-related protein 13b-like isoform X2 [Iris pallida]